MCVYPEITHFNFRNNHFIFTAVLNLWDFDLFSRKAFVVSSGCPESRIDSTRVKNFLIENGWTMTDKITDADLVAFRACGLTDTSIEKSLQLIGSLKARMKGTAQFIVWGCLPKINMEALKTVYEGITFGEDEINIFNKILQAKKPIEEVTANSCMTNFELKQGFRGKLSKLDKYFSRKYSIVGKDSIFEIKVSTGCLGNCSFCNVRRSRGLVHSKSTEEVVTEFRNGLKKGYRYFGLLATDLGAYGRDRGCNLVDLLVELTKEKGDYKIGLRNVNPHFLIEMFEELRPIFASGKIWFLSSSVESGSDRILKLMQRRYQVQDFIECIRIINSEYPNILLRTQILVGFPSETNKDFQMTTKLFDELKFDWVEIYKFSSCKGTTAAKMPNQISESTKETRFMQLFLKTRLQRPQEKLKQILA